MTPFSGSYIITIILLALISVFCLQFNSDGPWKSPFHSSDRLPLLSLSVSWPILRSLYSTVELLPTFVSVVSSPETKLKDACFYNNIVWMEFHNKSKSTYGGDTFDIKKCSYLNINGCRTYSPDNLMRSFFNSHGQQSEPGFSKFLDKEICSDDLCEEMLINSDIFELSYLIRELVGEGSHRQLVTTMEFYHHPKLTHFFNEHFCEAIVIEYLPTGVFSDPFELQRLVSREVFLNAYVFGDTNLELPSALSNISVVEIHINVKSDAQKIIVQLPLHSRYPPLSSSDYINIKIGKPHLFMHCKAKISRTATYSWTLINFGVLFGNNVTWRIPCGNAVQTRAVTIITFLSSIFCSLFIVLSTIYHSKKGKSKME